MSSNLPALTKLGPGTKVPSVTVPKSVQSRSGRPIHPTDYKNTSPTFLFFMLLSLVVVLDIVLMNESLL